MRSGRKTSPGELALWAMQEGLVAAMADEGLTIEGVWARVRGRMRLDCGESEFRSWLKPLELVEAHPGGMVLAVPSRFMRDWVATHYLDRIGQISREEVGRPISVEVVARPGPRPSPKSAAANMR